MFRGTIKTFGYKMYTLNKKLHGQKYSSQKTRNTPLTISKKMIENLKLDRTLIQGIDPGIVTAASISCIKPEPTSGTVMGQLQARQLQVISHNVQSLNIHFDQNRL